MFNRDTLTKQKTTQTCDWRQRLHRWAHRAPPDLGLLFTTARCVSMSCAFISQAVCSARNAEQRALCTRPFALAGKFPFGVSKCFPAKRKFPGVFFLTSEMWPSSRDGKISNVIEVPAFFFLATCQTGFVRQCGSLTVIRHAGRWRLTSLMN